MAQQIYAGTISIPTTNFYYHPMAECQIFEHSTEEIRSILNCRITRNWLFVLILIPKVIFIPVLSRKLIVGHNLLAYSNITNYFLRENFPFG